MLRVHVLTYSDAACSSFCLFGRRVFKLLSIQTRCVFKFLPIQTPRVQIYVYLDMALIIQLDDIVRVLLNTDLNGQYAYILYY